MTRQTQPVMGQAKPNHGVETNCWNCWCEADRGCAGCTCMAAASAGVAMKLRNASRNASVDWSVRQRGTPSCEPPSVCLHYHPPTHPPKQQRLQTQETHRPSVAMRWVLAGSSRENSRTVQACHAPGGARNSRGCAPLSRGGETNFDVTQMLHPNVLG